MPDTKPENPPAFPTHSVGKEPGTAHFQESHGGMTLRDYFAAKATEEDIDEHLREGYTREQAKFVYADRMLRARNGGAS